MSFYKDYKVNEGLLILTDLLKILYIYYSYKIPMIKMLFLLISFVECNEKKIKKV